MGSETAHLSSETAHLNSTVSAARLHRMTSDTAHLRKEMERLHRETAHLHRMTSDTAHLGNTVSNMAHLHSDMAHAIRITPTDPFNQSSTLSLSIFSTGIQHQQGTQALLYPSQNVHTPSHANPNSSLQHMHSPAIQHQETNGTRFQQPRVHIHICP